MSDWPGVPRPSDQSDLLSKCALYLCMYLYMTNVFYFHNSCAYCGCLSESGPVHHLGDLNMLPKFATVSTSTGLPCIYVAWVGVGQWSDRNPKGTHQVPCKFRKYYKNNNPPKKSSKAHWSYL